MKHVLIMISLVLIGAISNNAIAQLIIYNSSPRTKTVSGFGEEVNDGKTITLNKDGSQSWSGEYRHWHVTPTGDTIVSFLNDVQAREFRENQEKQINFIPQFNYQLSEDMGPRTEVVESPMSRGIMDLVYDITDPSFGLVPFRHGNDTIPLNEDIAIKNKANKIIQLEAEIAADQTDLINASTSGWNCDRYSTQDATINKFGVYDIENSTLSSGSGNLPFDFSYNGQGEIPGYCVTTTTTDGGPHAICGAFIGTDNIGDNDAADFNQWYFWEPQTDAQVQPGDYSMDANHQVAIKWYGYYWNEPQQIWKYGSRNILKYDLLNEVATLTFQSPDLTTEWTPMGDVIYPGDQTHQFPADTSVAVNGQPTDLYTGTQVSHSDNSNMTNNGTCTDVTNTTDRTWELIAGDYNSTNTAAASHIQHINIEDTTPPTADFSGNLDLEYYVGIESTLNPSLFSTTNIQDNSNLPVTENVVENNSQVNNGTCSQVDFVYSNDVSLEDVCSNSLNHFYTANVSDNTPPIVGNFPEDQQVEYRPDMNLTPSAMGEPTDITDNSGLETILSHEDNSNQGAPETYNYYNFTLTRTHNVNDVCYNLTDGDQSIQVNDTESPEYTSFPEDITITKYESMGPENTGYPTWEDSSGSDVTPNYYDEQLSESPFEHYARHWTGEDYSNNTSIDSIQNITVDLLENINENLEDRAYVFPNPSNGNFTLHYNQPGTIKVGTYDLSGRQIGEEQIYENLPKDANIPYHNLNAVANGLYILKIQDSEGNIENLLIEIQNNNFK